MLATLVIWMYTLFVLAGWGLGARRLLERGTRMDARSLPLVLLWGLVSATTAAAALSLFLPTGLLTTILLAAGALAGLWYSRGAGRFAVEKLTPLAGGLALVTLVGVLNAATLPASNPDTGIYHAQAVHWIESYPAVPGLGNFHARLAYNSHWFVSTAAFSLAFLGLGSFHLTGSVLFLTAALYFFSGIEDLIERRVSPPAVLKLAFFPLATYLLAGDISSPTPDLPAVLLAWICFLLYLEAVFDPARASQNDLLLAALAAFAVTVKLSAAPVLLLPALRLIHSDRRRAALMLGLGGLVALPWLARNVILSGYLVFPGLAVDLFHADWRVPAEGVRAERLGIATFARLPRLPASEVQAMPLATWSRLWFNNLTANRQLAFLAALFSPVWVGLTLLAGWAALRRVGLLWTSMLHIVPAWAVSYAGFLFWFFSAPAVRFGYGFLAAAPLLALLPALYLGASRWPKAAQRAGLLAALFLIAYQGAAILQSLDPATLPARLALPAGYTNLPTEPCKTGHLSAFCPSQWQECGYDTFPCTPSLNPRVVMRGKDWGAGFRSLEVSP